MNHPSSDTREVLSSEEGPRGNKVPLGLGDIRTFIFYKDNVYVITKFSQHLAQMRQGAG